MILPLPGERAGVRGNFWSRRLSTQLRFHDAGSGVLSLLLAIRALRPATPRTQITIHCFSIERFRIVIAYPFEQFRIRRHFWLPEGFENLVIARDTTAVVKRASPLASQANRVTKARIEGQHLLEPDFVEPAVAKIILIQKDLAFARQDLPGCGLVFVFAFMTELPKRGTKTLRGTLNPCMWPPPHPMLTWMIPCRVPSVQLSGTSRRRQIGGLMYLKVILTCNAL
jgi:hypothetical protein